MGAHRVDEVMQPLNFGDQLNLAAVRQLRRTTELSLQPDVTANLLDYPQFALMREFQGPTKVLHHELLLCSGPQPGFASSSRAAQSQVPVFSHLIAALEIATAPPPN